MRIASRFVYLASRVMQFRNWSVLFCKWIVVDLQVEWCVYVKVECGDLKIVCALLDCR